MKKSNSQLVDRAKYVQETVRNAPKTDKAITDLSNELFLSERTISNDLVKDVDSM